MLRYDVVVNLLLLLYNFVFFELENVLGSLVLWHLTSIKYLKFIRRTCLVFHQLGVKFGEDNLWPSENGADRNVS